MKKRFLALTLGLAGLMFSCGDKNTTDKDGFITDKESGVLYKIHSSVKENSNEPKIKIGDFVSVNMIYKTDKDSVLMDTKGQAIDLTVSEGMFKGDIMDGFKLLRKGDSASFKIPVDSVFAEKFGLQRPPFLNAGSMLVFSIKVENVKSEEGLVKVAEEGVQNFISNSPDKDGFRKLESGVYIHTKKAGSGDNIKMGDSITVHYTGKLLDGTVFDSSLTRNEPFELVLLEDTVIQGWVDALQSMKRGEEATIVIPYNLAYGENAVGPIPSYSPLVFEIQIVK